jgi:hypothetical protein
MMGGGRMKPLLAAAASLALGISPLFGSAGALADAPPVLPHVTDRAGDANSINGQGLLGGGEIGNDTRPASIDSADIVAIYYETLYDTVRERDGGGNIVAVHYVQHSVRISIETNGPAKPTYGPTVMFRIPARLNNGACEVFFDGYVRGTAPGANELERADINRLSAQCGESGFLTEGFTISYDGNFTRLTYPFDMTMGLLAPGVSFETSSKAGVRTASGPGTMPNPSTHVIDETAVPGRWVIGIDVPPSVDCTATPGHADCQEP